MVIQNQQRESQAVRDYRYHLDNTDIGYTFNDDQIACLAQQKGEIGAEISLLGNQLTETNPNVQILAQYKQRKMEYNEKERSLRELEENLAKRKAEHDALKTKRHDIFREGFQMIAEHVK
jgi:structural maintenance of chromosome 4